MFHEPGIASKRLSLPSGGCFSAKDAFALPTFPNSDSELKSSRMHTNSQFSPIQKLPTLGQAAHRQDLPRYKICQHHPPSSATQILSAGERSVSTGSKIPAPAVAVGFWQTPGQSANDIPQKPSAAQTYDRGRRKTTSHLHVSRNAVASEPRGPIASDGLVVLRANRGCNHGNGWPHSPRLPRPPGCVILFRYARWW